jgi:hypothetical protein
VPLIIADAIARRESQGFSSNHHSTACTSGFFDKFHTQYPVQGDKAKQTHSPIWKLKSGEILEDPDTQKQNHRVNSSPDMEIMPAKPLIIR